MSAVLHFGSQKTCDETLADTALSTDNSDHLFYAGRRIQRLQKALLTLRAVGTAA